ncbi:hypothetical protein JCM8115_006554 [Rhodotorula mucilaginosa]
MPTARHSSSSSALWPTYYPPALRSLSDPRPHPEPAKLPPSVRYRNHNYHRTLQDDLDDLDNDEDNHYNQVYDLRQYGHSWLVPLGRQRTHDEEVDSQYHSSPNHHPTDGDLSFSPPLHPIDGGGGGGGGGGGPQVEYYDGVLNLDELARRPGPLRIPPRDDDDDDGGEGVVDLDAEIEDADATDLDSDDDDDDDERSNAAGDDNDDNARGGGTPTRHRRRPATHDSDDDDESMDV